MKTIRIGCGAGYAGDRWEPAVELLEKCDIDYLVFETLAERTIAREHIDRLKNPDRGYNPWLEARMRAVLPLAKKKGVQIITSMGAANPRAAAKRVLEIGRELGIASLKVAAVVGDDVTELVRGMDVPIMETGEPFSTLEPRMISANAYLGADIMAKALATGADVVVTGRVGDPSLFIAPMLHGLGWSYDDYERIGQGLIAAHLMECAGQVTGGYFADPGVKDVPNLDRLGFPIAEIGADGSVVITKVAEAGGMVTLATCKEQMLYEVHDPADYITPDCVADFSEVEFEQIGKDRVAVRGGRARPRTPTYKVSVGYRNGWIGEGQMSYGGPNAVARAKLARDVVVSRLKQRGIHPKELRTDFIGLQSLHDSASNGGQLNGPEPYEVRLRVAGLCDNERDAALLGHEVETLLCSGPAGGAGDFKAVREIIAVLSILLPRERVTPEVVVESY